MNHILLIDAGNTRFKWALVNRYGWSTLGSVPNADINQLALSHWQGLVAPLRIIGTNVAGKAAQHKIEAQMVRWHVPPEWLTPKAEVGGIKNGYANPSRLGADRWAMLAATWRRQQRAGVDGATPEPCLVVSFGTAITLDALTVDGTFLGGLILPGLSLMRNSLAANTAGLTPKESSGVYADFPGTTEDAIFSGTVQAVCGAIAKMRALLAARHDGKAHNVVLYVTGGDVPSFLPYLTEPVIFVDNLVFEGILTLAAPEYLPG